METLSTLTKTTVKQQKRVGRGYGSGVGRTSGRGCKGDKSRGTTKITFDGTKIKKGWIKRTPFLRGKNRVHSQTDQFILNFIDIERMFKVGENVDLQSISKKTGIHEKILVGNIKVLAKGTLTKSLNFTGIRLSQKAQDLIIASGGKID